MVINSSEMRLLAYSLLGRFNAGRNMEPKHFYYTPETQNGHWSFGSNSNAIINLGCFVENCYKKSGPKIIIHTPLRDEHLHLIWGNEISGFFYDLNDQRLVPKTTFLWKGHFFWFQSKPSGLFTRTQVGYGFQVVGSYGQSPSSEGPAIRFDLLRTIGSSSAEFFQNFLNLFHGFDPLVPEEMEKPLCVFGKLTAESDADAAKRYAALAKIWASKS